jgi:hypothetical protein
MRHKSIEKLWRRTRGAEKELTAGVKAYAQSISAAGCIRSGAADVAAGGAYNQIKSMFIGDVCKTVSLKNSCFTGD